MLGTLDEIDRWTAHAQTHGRPLPAILHVDTGMNRLGLDAHEMDALAADHGRLAGADAALRDDASGVRRMPGRPGERAAARAVRGRLRPLAAGPAVVRKTHRGLFLGPGYESDLARPGAALYGINPTPGRPNPMRPVVRLRARVLRLRDVPVGNGVGYNGQWVAARPSRIATVSVGYADGYLRSLTNRAVAFFDEQPVPLVGRVSMDLSTFDVTDAPGLRAGDWLDLIGPGGVDALANLAGTNGYEVLTLAWLPLPAHLSVILLDWLAVLGRGLLGICATAGAVAVFGGRGVSHIVRPPLYGRMFTRAFVEFGYFSLPVVALTAIFSGMVIALQSYTGFSRFNAESAGRLHRRAVGGARTGPGVGRADGGGPRRRRHGG